MKGCKTFSIYGKCICYEKISVYRSSFFVTAAVAFAQPKTDVNMRTSKQDGVLRLVLESEDAFLKKANASVSGLQLNVEFPSAFNIVSSKGINLDTSIKERSLTVNLKEPFDIKVLRLSSPARFVIDIMSKAAVDIKNAAGCCAGAENLCH